MGGGEGTSSSERGLLALASFVPSTVKTEQTFLIFNSVAFPVPCFHFTDRAKSNPAGKHPGSLCAADVPRCTSALQVWGLGVSAARSDPSSPPSSGGHSSLDVSMTQLYGGIYV